MIKIKLVSNVQPKSWEYILKHMDLIHNSGVEFVDNIKKADVLIFTLNSRVTFNKLPHLYKKVLMSSDIPIIIAERLDSSITWFREFNSIPNLKSVFKNKIIDRKSVV